MQEKEAKYIVVSGGVLSGLGKGLFISSLGFLLQSKGYKVVPIKIDPYLNVDAGTMNPMEHGEVFVLDDGTEADMDLGNYERFMNLTLTSKSNITTGKIFKGVIEKERRGDYLGQTVQLIPHITDELQRRYKEIAKENQAEIVLIEIGGTVGDIENQIFLESVRQLSSTEDVFFVHCSLVPILSVVGEQKTKPTQQSVKMLNEAGIFPDMIFARSSKELEEKTKEKISRFCGVKPEYVISGKDLKNIYEIPLVLEEQMVAEKILSKMGLFPKKNNLSGWGEFVSKMNNATEEITIAITGKYVDLKDSYVSIKESLMHCSGKFGCKINIRWIETSEIEIGKIKTTEVLKGVDGIIVPGGFGKRGIEGKIQCIQYAREKNIPFLGICLGFQLAVIEFARNVCGLSHANTTEIDPSAIHPVIDILEFQKKILDKGGTMRLGKYPAKLKDNSKIKELYGEENIFERHRHRFEVNPFYINTLEEKGLIFSGKSPDGELMEFLENPNLDFFIGTQAHPELTSKPLKPNPMFVGLIQSCLNRKHNF